MKVLRLSGIAAAICFLLFGMVNNSNAQILIIDMSISSEIYNYGYIYDSAYVKTDKPYDTIRWYIGDPDDPDGNYQYVGETLGDGVATQAWFSPSVSDCPGDIKGKNIESVPSPCIIMRKKNHGGMIGSLVTSEFFDRK